MPNLHIALHDGFRGHHVVISVAGHVVFDRPDVTTDLRISRADALDVEVSAPSVSVTVNVEPGGIAGTVGVDVVSTPFLAIDLQDLDKPRFNASAEPFRYM